MLRLGGIHKSLGGRPVLRGIELQLAATDTMAILGPNGAGKTTLLRIAATLSRPTKGTVHIGGIDADQQASTARRSIGFAPQQPSLQGESTPAEHLAWWVRLHRTKVDEPQALREAGLSNVAHRAAAQLSRGQRQRLALLLATVHAPPLLILDEPFTALDGQGAAWLETILAARRGKQATLMALHDNLQAQRLADRAAILDGGRLA